MSENDLSSIIDTHVFQNTLGNAEMQTRTLL